MQLWGVSKAPASLLGAGMPKALSCACQADPRSAFAAWAAHFGRSYAAESAEFEARLGAWLHTLRHVLDAPAHAGAEVPVNGFADMSDDEFRAAYLGQVTPDVGEDDALLGCAGCLSLGSACEAIHFEGINCFTGVSPLCVTWRMSRTCAAQLRCLLCK